MQSIFANRITKTLPVPGMDGQTITIRKLAPRHLEAAATEAQRKAIAASRAMADQFSGFDVAVLRDLRTLDTSKEAEADTADDGERAADAPAAANPLAGFDAVTLIEKGVTEWSFTEPLGREAFEEIDADTRDWLATEILRLSRPSLFQSADEVEQAQKNG
jgi:hypothetical protein